MTAFVDGGIDIGHAPSIGRDARSAENVKTIQVFDGNGTGHDLRFNSLRRFRYELIDDVFQVAGALEGGELAVGARPLLHNAIGVFYFLAAAKLIDDIADEPFDKFTYQVARWDFRLLAEIDQLAVESVAHGAPLVLFDQVEGVDAEGHIVAAQLPQLGDDGLEDGGDADRLVDARADIADAELQRRVRVVRAHVPPDFRAVGDGVGGDQCIDEVLVIGPGGEGARDAAAWEVSEDDAAVRFQAGVASHPEGRAGGQAQDMRQQVTNDVHGVDQEFAVLDADMHVRPEDQQALGQFLH